MNLIKTLLEKHITELGDDPNNFFKKKHAEEVLQRLVSRENSYELHTKKGGDWLGEARNWIQCKFSNGESVTWGSQDILEGKILTVSAVESFAAKIAAAAINEERKQLNNM